MAEVRVRLTVDEMRVAVSAWINSQPTIPLQIEPADVEFTVNEGLDGGPVTAVVSKDTTAVVNKDTAEMTMRVQVSELPPPPPTPKKPAVPRGSGRAATVAAPASPAEKLQTQFRPAQTRPLVKVPADNRTCAERVVEAFKRNNNTPMSVEMMAELLGGQLSTISGLFRKPEINRGRFRRVSRGLYNLSNP